MVYSASGELSSEIVVSLTRSVLDAPQQVSVRINGFEYPGEVIFADQWQAWFGSELPEQTMFRLVLLSESQRVDRADVTGRFVVVAIPTSKKSQAGSSDLTQLNREIGRLGEIRERYMTSSDSGLKTLTSTITGQTSEMEHNIAEALAERWRGGRIITTSDSEVPPIPADSIFVGHQPAVWVEATAAAMFTRPVTESLQPDRFLAEALFTRIAADGDLAWWTALDLRTRLAAGTELDKVVEDLDRSAAESPNDTIDGPRLRTLLLRHHRLPPGLASLVVIAYIRSRNAEAGMSPHQGDWSMRLDIHSLGTAVYDPELIYSVEWLSAVHIDDWNAALPYVKALLPHAEPSDDGVPTKNMERQFMQVLAVTESRTTLTVHTLEDVAGPAIEHLPDMVLANRLGAVLESDSWRSFYINARKAFPNAAEFTEAVAVASRLRVLSEDIVDLQAARDYVAMADFGRADQALAADTEALLQTLDVTRILTNHSSTSAELQKFQQWKRHFTRSYLAHHSERRSAELKLAKRMKKANMQHGAVVKLSSIPELEGIYDLRFQDTWNELVERVKPCPNREHEVALQRQPYCAECGVRLGSAGADDEVERCISEIEEMMRQASDRLGKIAASRVLNRERVEELQQLIAINSIADLTAISHVLDDGVPEFLERFASETPGRSV